MSELTYKEKLDECIEDIEVRSAAGTFIFSDWEKNFLKSVEAQFAQRDTLSPKQIAIVEKCWNKLALEEEDRNGDETPGVDFFKTNRTKYRDDFSD